MGVSSELFSFFLFPFYRFFFIFQKNLDVYSLFIIALFGDYMVMVMVMVMVVVVVRLLGRCYVVAFVCGCI